MYKGVEGREQSVVPTLLDLSQAKAVLETVARSRESEVKSSKPPAKIHGYTLPVVAQALEVATQDLLRPDCPLVKKGYGDTIYIEKRVSSDDRLRLEVSGRGSIIVLELLPESVLALERVNPAAAFFTSLFSNRELIHSRIIVDENMHRIINQTYADYRYNIDLRTFSVPSTVDAQRTLRRGLRWTAGNILAWRDTPEVILPEQLDDKFEALPVEWHIFGLRIIPNRLFRM